MPNQFQQQVRAPVPMGLPNYNTQPVMTNQNLKQGAPLPGWFEHGVRTSKVDMPVPGFSQRPKSAFQQGNASESIVVNNQPNFTTQLQQEQLVESGFRSVVPTNAMSNFNVRDRVETKMYETETVSPMQANSYVVASPQNNKIESLVQEYAKPKIMGTNNVRSTTGLTTTQGVSKTEVTVTAVQKSPQVALSGGVSNHPDVKAKTNRVRAEKMSREPVKKNTGLCLSMGTHEADQLNTGISVSNTPTNALSTNAGVSKKTVTAGQKTATTGQKTAVRKASDVNVNAYANANTNITATTSKKSHKQ